MTVVSDSLVKSLYTLGTGAFSDALGELQPEALQRITDSVALAAGGCAVRGRGILTCSTTIFTPWSAEFVEDALAGVQAKLNGVAAAQLKIKALCLGTGTRIDLGKNFPGWRSVHDTVVALLAAALRAEQAAA
jgi:hypothetical protein